MSPVSERIFFSFSIQLLRISNLFLYASVFHVKSRHYFIARAPSNPLMNVHFNNGHSHSDGRWRASIILFEVWNVTSVY